MRTFISLDHELMKTASVKTLIALEAGRRLAALGGSDPKATAAPRRRST